MRNLALTLAREERLPAEQLEVVQLAALLHDLHDWKYSGSATAGAEAAAAWLRGQVGTRGVTRRSLLGDAKSSLGDAKERAKELAG